MKSFPSSLSENRRNFAPNFDSLKLLADREHRDRYGLYFAEGFRFAHEAIKNPQQIVAVGWCPGLAKPYSTRPVKDAIGHVPQFNLSEAEIASLGFSPEPQGVVLILKQQVLSLFGCTSSRTGAWVGLESVRSPGNFGTVFRSMAASAAKGLILFSSRGQFADPYDPQVVRASMGALVNMPIVRTSYRDFARWALRSEFRVLGADAKGSLDYRRIPFRRPTLLMVGDEKSGLSPGQRSACDDFIKIPMAKHVDSLNFAMAATVILFESFHQNAKPRR